MYKVIELTFSNGDFLRVNVTNLTEEKQVSTEIISEAIDMFALTYQSIISRYRFAYLTGRAQVSFDKLIDDIIKDIKAKNEQ